MADAQQYADQLQALLPRGKAWPDEPSSRLRLLLLGLADELARLDARALTALVESDPRRTTELLADWERVTDLPAECLSQPGTYQERRDAVVARLTQLGAQSRAYFIALAASVGFGVSITEFRPFRVGFSHAGDDLADEDWAFTWRVNAPEETVRYFSVGQSNVGEALASWGNELLECTLNKVKPAHTVLLFGYGNNES